MGLFSKLLGPDQEGKSVLDSIQKVADLCIAESAQALKSVQNAASNALEKSEQQTMQGQQSVQPQTFQQAQTFQQPQNVPSQAAAYMSGGVSWGEEMPAEPNQYNFAGPYTAYFESIFRECFPEYRVTSESVRKGTARIHTFYAAERKVLVVELMSERCNAKKLRSDCAAEGIPYLRFYYDHEGWWNTRSYVIGRIQKALGQ